jgi:hypothetical protein
MDINNFIADRGKLIRTAYILDQIGFAIVHSLDKCHKHIPDWYKDLRVGKLIDYFINEGIINKSQVRYTFTKDSQENFLLIYFAIVDLSLAQLTVISNILPSGDIKSHLGFNVSEPYYLAEDKDKLLEKYRLNCKL